MKIVSNFKDYYDFMQQYGIDEKIVFNRIDKSKLNYTNSTFHLPDEEDLTSAECDKINNVVLNFKKENEETNKIFSLLSDYSRANSEKDFNLALEYFVVSINSKLMDSICLTMKSNSNSYENPMIREFIKRNISEEQAYDLLKEKISSIVGKTSLYHKYLLKESFQEYFKKTRYYHEYNSSMKVGSINSESVLQELHIKCNSPIVFINYSSLNRSPKSVRVYKNIPLSYLGINNAFDSTEKLLQEISYCIGNVLTNKNEPPIAVDNKTKIEQHGFDYKKSFRHRK